MMPSLIRMHERGRSVTVREGRLELPRPLGHGILSCSGYARNPDLRVVLCRLVSSCVHVCRPCREQDVSKASS
jgi:hypothetical protein